MKAAEKANVWSWQLPGTAQAGPAPSLEVALEMDTSLNHQKFGRPMMLDVGGQ